MIFSKDSQSTLQIEVQDDGPTDTKRSKQQTPGQGEDPNQTGMMSLNITDDPENGTRNEMSESTENSLIPAKPGEPMSPGQENDNGPYMCLQSSPDGGFSILKRGPNGQTIQNIPIGMCMANPDGTPILGGGGGGNGPMGNFVRE